MFLNQNRDINQNWDRINEEILKFFKSLWRLIKHQSYSVSLTKYNETGALKFPQSLTVQQVSSLRLTSLKSYPIEKAYIKLKEASNTNHSHRSISPKLISILYNVMKSIWKNLPKFSCKLRTLSPTVLQNIICKIQESQSLLTWRAMKLSSPRFNNLLGFIHMKNTPMW